MSNSPRLNPTGDRQWGWGIYRVVQEYGLIIILVAFTVLGLLYDVTVPVFEKPDELKHFAVIQYIQTQHRLPVVIEGTYRPWDQEATQPPLYHILAAVAASWLDLRNFQEPPRNPHYADERSFIWRERGNNNLYLHGVGEAWSTEPVFLAVRLARWLSLLAGLGTITLTYVLGRIVFTDGRLINESAGKERSSQQVPSQPFAGRRSLPLLAAGMIAFIPQFLHVSSAITNDSLSATIAAATLVLLALVIKNGGSTGYAVYLGLALGLGAVTKLSLLYLVPLTGLVLLLDFGRHRSLGRLVTFGAIIAGLTLLLAGWWYWRNWQLYGDVTALNAHLLYRGGPLDPRPGLAQIWQTELTGLELSFWAAFGAGQILLEPWLYAGLRGVKYLVGLGLMIGVWRSFRYQVSGVKCQVSSTESRSTQNVSSLRFQVSGFTFYVLRFTVHVSRFTSHLLHHPRPLSLTLLALWTLIIFVALLRWMQITPASWGRLLYPALPALGVLSAWALSQFRLPITLRTIDDGSPSTHPCPESRLEHSRRGSRRNASRITTFYVLRFTHHAPGAWLASGLALPSILVLALFLLSLIGPFRYIRAAYAKTPLMSEAEVPTEGVNRLDFVYDDALRLIGYNVSQSSVQPGDRLPVTLYWQARRPITKNYSVFVHLLGRDNAVVGQVNTYPGGGNWPTSLLEPDKVLRDTYHVRVSPEAQVPAVIRLAVGIFEFDDPLRAAKVAVNPAGDVVEPIVDAVPLLPHEWPRLAPAHPAEANFAGQIKLAGYDWPNEKVKPGAIVPVTFYWETLTAPGQNLTLFIHLVDPVTTEQVAGFDAPPDFPTSYWQPGNTIIDSRLLSMPADLPAGDYRLVIGWYNPKTSARLPLVTQAEATGAFSLLKVPVMP